MKKFFVIVIVILSLLSCTQSIVEPDQDEENPYNLQIEFIENNVIELSWNRTNSNNLGTISKKTAESEWDNDYYVFDSETTSMIDTILTQSNVIISYYLSETSEDFLVGISDTIAWICDDYIPIEFTAEHVKQDSINLEWFDKSFGEFTFRIDRKIGNEIWNENHIIYEPITNNIYNSYMNCRDCIEVVDDTIFYRICIQNGKSQSTFNETSIFVSMLPPFNLAATIEQTYIRLHWEENCSIESGFLIERKTLGGEYHEIASVNADVTSWLDTELDPSQIYFYRVKMFSEDFNSEYSNQVIGNIDHEGYWVPLDFPTIQDAVDATYSSVSITILPGIYYENVQINDKYPSISSLYSLLGDEQYIEQTIIDGDQNGSVFSFINCDYNDTPSISGLTLRNGSGRYTSYSGGSTYFNCGGGILLEYSKLNVYKLKIIDNSSDFGGGIACVQYSNCYLENTLISNNNCNNRGGGIYCNESALTIIESTITENFAHTDGGGVSCSHSAINLSNTSISSNNSSRGGGIVISSCSNSILEDLLISNNFAHDYGGMSISGSGIIVKNIIISNNSANGGNGGGLSLGNLEYYTFENILVINNTADYGAGIYKSGSDTNITNITAYGNVAELGGGAFYSRHHSDTVIMNSIFWNNSPQEIMIRPGNMPSTEGSVTILYSNIEGGLENVSALNSNNIHWLQGNIANNPLFQNPADEDFHLQPNSPCIDAGNLERIYTDIDGTRNDMGAYGGPNAGL